jgi:hypothetical protein
LLIRQVSLSKLLLKSKKEAETMKRTIIAAAVVLGIGISGFALANYWGGYGSWSPMGMAGYSCPMWGRGYAGPYGGPGAGSYEGASLTQRDAEAIARNYIGPNPNLKLGRIEEKETHFEAEILTKDGSRVSRLSIDKNTGWVRPIY